MKISIGRFYGGGMQMEVMRGVEGRGRSWHSNYVVEPESWRTVD